jgi:hypothetical protein
MFTLFVFGVLQAQAQIWDPYQLPMLPMCEPGKSFYPCYYQGRLIQSAFEDPFRVEPKAKALEPLIDPRKSPYDRLCPVGKHYVQDMLDRDKDGRVWDCVPDKPEPVPDPEPQPVPRPSPVPSPSTSSSGRDEIPAPIGSNQPRESVSPKSELYRFQWPVVIVISLIALAVGVLSGRWSRRG